MLTDLSVADMDFIRRYATKITVADENWYHIPFWFKHYGNTVVESFSFDKLPDYVKQELQKQRINEKQF